MFEFHGGESVGVHFIFTSITCCAQLDVAIRPVCSGCVPCHILYDNTRMKFNLTTHHGTVLPVKRQLNTPAQIHDIQSADNKTEDM